MQPCVKNLGYFVNTGKTSGLLGLSESYIDNMMVLSKVKKGFLKATQLVL